ncbi:MAG: hypothetical protein HY561_03720, partial [Gemmatimonadetes bacterium]|nr:hypothetical protein [Gemmatimonadota bacterium]
TTQSGGGLTPVTTDEVAVYVIPLMTALKFYPATRPGDPLEPYLLAGVGFAFGVEDSDSGTGIAQGFGFKAGSGLDWRLSPAFALTLGARYQWLKFFEGDPGGMETFKGFGFDAGLTYRFQYQ